MTEGEIGVDLAALFADPVRFARSVLQADLWESQEHILAALAKPNARVAVKSCHASGKSHVSAAAALWFPIAHPDGITLTTAPTWTQVSKTLWGEIHTHIGKCRIILPKASTTELRFGPKNYALGLSTNEGVRFQGLRANRTLIVLDEAPGIKPEIWEAIESIRAGGDVRILAIGNPTIPGGQQLLVPAGFGVYGHYRAGALDDNRAHALAFAGQGACQECHTEEASARKAGHAGVACEACHGPLARHAADPEQKPAKPDGRDLCLACHTANVARPAKFPQIEPQEHAESGLCTECHQAHNPGTAP